MSATVGPVPVAISPWQRLAAAQARGVDVLNTDDDDEDVLDIEEAEELFEEGAATAEELVEAITGQKMEELDPSESDQPDV